jgi:hypothetical protein
MSLRTAKGQHTRPAQPPRAEGRAARRCDNITISPALLGELAASTEPLPRKLWPEMGGGEGAPVDLSASQVPPPLHHC